MLPLGPARARMAARVDLLDKLEAPGLPVMRARVLLPLGYGLRDHRYGVLYVMDGQWGFGDPANSFSIDRAFGQARRRMKSLPWIVVAVDNLGDDRFRQFLPQSVYAAAEPALKARLDKELAGKPILSGRFLDFVADRLRPLVDSRYRTRPGPEHTAILGASMAGPFASVAMIERPDAFGRAASLSPQWPYYDLAMIDPPELMRFWPAAFAKLGPPAGRLLWLETGTTMIDGGFVGYQAAIADALRRHGWQDGLDLMLRVRQGGGHTWPEWAAEMNEILPWLLAEARS